MLEEDMIGPTDSIPSVYPLPSPLKRDIDDSRPNLRISFKSEASLRDTLVSRSQSVRLPFQTSSALNGNVI